MEKVYIAAIEKIIPERYAASYIVDKFYPIEKYGQDTNLLAQRLARKFQIPQRSCVLDFDEFPKIVLKNEEDHPLSWGINMINQLTNNINKNEIGFFSLSYNLSFHKDTLPNLATQIALSSELNHLDRVEEIANYGCASSIYSIENAMHYCQTHNRAALVFTFDQCFEKGLQIDRNDDDFNKLLITNLLFTDGGVGILMIPERMRDNFNHSLLEIQDTMTRFKMGSLIQMKNQRFLMSNELKNEIPKLTCDLLLKPFLKKHNLLLEDIEEWAIHQGGSELIKQFCKKEILGLTEKQIERSLNAFFEYGNVSSASCLLVLESFFNTQKTNKQKSSKGIVLAFGAGYYLGAMHYIWKIKDNY